MNAVVIYNSQTGFTERYARWIAEAAGADCLTLAAAKKQDLSAYDAIVFGSWACAGNVSKLSWFQKNANQWVNKKLIVFCVGASPDGTPEVEQLLKKAMEAPELKAANAFYCPGGFNYEKMSAPSKFVMKLFVKTLNAKKGKTETDEAMIKMISSSYDISEQKYIEPILECLR